MNQINCGVGVLTRPDGQDAHPTGIAVYLISIPSYLDSPPTGKHLRAPIAGSIAMDILGDDTSNILVGTANSRKNTQLSFEEMAMNTTKRISGIALVTALGVVSLSSAAHAMWNPRNGLSLNGLNNDLNNGLNNGLTLGGTSLQGVELQGVKVEGGQLVAVVQTD